MNYIITGICITDIKLVKSFVDKNIENLTDSNLDADQFEEEQTKMEIGLNLNLRILCSRTTYH